MFTDSRPAMQTLKFSKHALDFFSLLDSDTKRVVLSQSSLMERCTAGATSSDEAAAFGYLTLESGGSNNCSHPRGMIEHASSHSFEVATAQVPYAVYVGHAILSPDR